MNVYSPIIRVHARERCSSVEIADVNILTSNIFTSICVCSYPVVRIVEIADAIGPQTLMVIVKSRDIAKDIIARAVNYAEAGRATVVRCNSISSVARGAIELHAAAL